MRAILLSICIAVTMSQAAATTRYVDDSVASSGAGTSWATAFKAIQEGIDAASIGDTVIVAEGTYFENIEFKGKNIVLTSTDPLDPNVVANTVIDGNQAGSVVTFSGTEDETCVLSGFTIRNGKAVEGGGIHGGAYPYTCATIQNNTITGNTAEYGGGLYACDGTIQNNTITGNSAFGAGNSSGGGLDSCYRTIQNNIIRDNHTYYSGGGLNWCVGTIQNNTIVGNSADICGGGLAYCYQTAIIQNCILWGNTAKNGPQLQFFSKPTYCCIEGWTEQSDGNMAFDPQFVDPDGPDNDPATYEDNNYRLSTGSPCIDAGKNEDWLADAVDLDGKPRIINGTVDMGAYEYGERIAHPCDDNQDLVIDDWELLRAIDAWAKDERKNGWPQNLEDYDWALLELIDLWAPGTEYDPSSIVYR